MLFVALSSGQGWPFNLRAQKGDFCVSPTYDGALLAGLLLLMMLHGTLTLVDLVNFSSCTSLMGSTHAARLSLT